MDNRVTRSYLLTVNTASLFDGLSNSGANARIAWQRQPNEPTTKLNANDVTEDSSP